MLTHKLFFFVIIVICISGCSSIITNTQDKYDVKVNRYVKNAGLGTIYSGTRFNFNSLYCLADGDPLNMISLVILGPFIIVDIPLSFAMDTLLIPADLANDEKEVRSKNICRAGLLH